MADIPPSGEASDEPATGDQSWQQPRQPAQPPPPPQQPPPPPQQPPPPYPGQPAGSEAPPSYPTGYPPGGPPPPGYPPGGPPPPGYPPGGYPPGGYPQYGYPPSAPGYGYGSRPPSVYASYGARVGGWIIDAVIVWVVSLLITIPINAARVGTLIVRNHAGVRSGRVSILAIVIETVIFLLYGAIFCGSARGQTPGMMAVGARAVDRDTGRPIGFGRALGRVAFAYLLALLFFVPWIVDMLFPLWDAQSQTLHDKVSRTVVVRASLVPPASRS